jgi:uncharacterized protein (TIGR03083 family)
VTGPRGLADRRPDALAPRVLAAWDAFLAVAAAAELDAPSRLTGWTGHDVCVHLGRWPEHAPTDGVVAAARTGELDDARPAGSHDQDWVASRRAASRPEILAALEAERAAVADYFSSGAAAELGRRLAPSMLGPLPATTVVVAACYELAVHALDLGPCGAPDPPAGLLHEGLGALTDTTAALAHRLGIEVTMSVQAPDGGWAMRVDAGGWQTAERPPGPVGGAAVLGDAVTLLDASAGRASVPPLLANGRLKVQGVATLLRLAPVIERVPGLPGRPALLVAARAIGGVGRLLGRG